MAAPPLSAVGELARRGDPDRFRAAMFAPAARRDALFALIAFNLELAKIGPTVSEPMLGEIRLAWWREALDDLFAGGPVRGHEVIGALAADPPPDPAPLYAMVEARAFDIGAAGIADEAALDAYLAETGGALARALAASLGAGPAARDVAGRAGAAEAAGRLIGAGLRLISDGLRPFPVEGEYDLDALRAGRTPPALAASVARTARRGLDGLRAARAARAEIPRAARPALLSAHMAERTLSAALAAKGDLFRAAAPVSPFREAAALAFRAATGRF